MGKGNAVGRFGEVETGERALRIGSCERPKVGCVFEVAEISSFIVNDNGSCRPSRAVFFVSPRSQSRLMKKRPRVETSRGLFRSG